MARYACSDFHGRYDLAQQAISHLGPDDRLFYLGDAIDRGPRSLDTLDLLINHPQVTFFLGNHEDMMLKTMMANTADVIAIDHYLYDRNDAQYIWCRNGGYDTFEELTNLRERDPEAFNLLINKVQASHRDYICYNALNQMVILSHAGFTPGCREPNLDAQLWDRNHIKHQWPNKLEYANVIIVHGHTSIHHITGFQDSYNPSLWYCNRHKVCIDFGSAYTGYAVMINLDTWESITLEGDHKYDIQ